MHKLLDSLFKREQEKSELDKFLKDDKPNPQFWNEVLKQIKTGS